MFIDNLNNKNGATKQSATPAAQGGDPSLPKPPFSGAVPATAAVPDPQVTAPEAKATRRQFSLAYKLAILAEADACTQPGQIGALLRREGLYASTLTSFRQQRAQGHLVVKTAEQKRTERRERLNEQQRDRRRLALLEQENQKLRLLVEIQKKLSEMLQISLETPQIQALKAGIE
jgi:transposase